MRKGWFRIPGVQEGDRDLREQLKGLGAALDACPGKTVLDLGCAEGLIARRFAEAGASLVHGVEIVAGHVEEARRQCAGFSACSFECADLNALERIDGRYDIVLMLAVLHKLRDPVRLARIAARACDEMVVLRLPPAHAPSIVDARSGNRPHDVGMVMQAEGFRLSSIQRGHFDEWMGYYRRER